MRNIDDDDFPGLFISSDKASKAAQEKYIRVMTADLISMVLAATAAIYNYESTSYKRVVYVIVGISMLAGLILSIILMTRKFEDTWYQGRALAESCKTLTWRYMMRSELFETAIQQPTLDQNFRRRLSDIQGEFKELYQVLDVEILNKELISDHMKNVRALAYTDRLKYYIENRIEDQKKWYSKKATFNEDEYSKWFWIIIGTQIVSLLAIVYLIASPESSWNLVGLFTTFTASSISWLQLKRHQELKQAYTTASNELNLIAASAGEVIDDDTLSKFVLDSENAVSREHTLWLAQKRKL